MQKWIHGDLVDIVIVRKKNKNIYFRFQEDKKLYVSCNTWVTQKEIAKLIEQNMEKITKMYLNLCNRLENDSYFQYLGKKYTIVYNENYKKPTFDADLLFVKNQKALDTFYKSEVKRIFTSEVNRILPFFPNIPSFTLKFRTMKTRWGVNNRGNNTITLNTELLKKEIDLLDYVIIHELCHFYEPNHSAQFWNHVEKYYPKYKEARKRLRS